MTWIQKEEREGTAVGATLTSLCLMKFEFGGRVVARSSLSLPLSLFGVSVAFCSDTCSFEAICDKCSSCM